MKRIINLTSVILLTCLSSSLFGWENKRTHPAITKEALSSNLAKADDYLKTQLGLSGGLLTDLYWNFPQDIKTRINRGSANSNQKTRTVLDWIRTGSIIEDTEPNWDNARWLAPWRARHHFYDPTRNAGLDNHTGHPDWDAPGTSSWLPLGAPTLNWAIDGNAIYEPTTNNDNWITARNIFYYALTAQDPNDRKAYLAESMLKLGCVLHLLEDMGVPAHTRNDFLFAHYRHWYNSEGKGEPFEKNIEERIEANDGNSLWSGNSVVAFDKLKNYFDTDARDPYEYLGNGILPPETWGLAEATNYQFWSLSTINSYLPKYYFEHPHIALCCGILEETEPNAKKLYFKGNKYGVNHMGRSSYTQFYIYTACKYAGYGEELQKKVDSTITTDDEKVFDDYAAITIPRTINYATGLTNYFFRGKLSATAECIECNTIELTITNKSENSGIQQTLKGGAFEFYWDDSNDIRTQINDVIIDNGWTSSSTLNYNSSITATFMKPDTSEPTKYIIVYKGNICESPENIDNDDVNAIATTSVSSQIDDCCYDETDLVITFEGVKVSANQSINNCAFTAHCYSYEFYENRYGVRSSLDPNLTCTPLVNEPAGIINKTWHLPMVHYNEWKIENAPINYKSEYFDFACSNKTSESNDPQPWVIKVESWDLDEWRIYIYCGGTYIFYSYPDPEEFPENYIFQNSCEEQGGGWAVGSGGTAHILNPPIE